MRSQSFMLSLAAVAVATGCAKSKSGTGADATVTDTAQISISPATPHTRDDLHAVVTDPSGATYGFRWSVDDAPRADLTGVDVSADMTTKGQRWKVELLVGTATVASSEVTILDSPPDPPVIAVPATTPVGGPIQCTITTPSTDADGDPVTYSAAWQKNGQAVTGAVATTFTGDTVPSTMTATEGDMFVCIVTASDGEASTTARSSNALVSCAGVPIPGPTTFSFTGAPQPYTIATCVKHVTIEAWGAQGGGTNGGLGGYARGNLDTTTGLVLYVEVGGKNGYNGGGAGVATTNPANGGGASDVRVAMDDLPSRVLVAGGGGGGGNGDGHYLGGAGGGGTCGTGFCGGGGGIGYAPSGANGNGSPGGEFGGNGVSAQHGGGGGGGGHSGGGNGSCESYDPPTKCGGQGTPGQGGSGEPTQQAVRALCYSTYGGTAGGGGGYWGGGGTATGFCGSGAGGGGSSFTGTLGAPGMTGGVKPGDGQVVITPY